MHNVRRHNTAIVSGIICLVVCNSVVVEASATEQTVASDCAKVVTRNAKKAGTVSTERRANSLATFGVVQRYAFEHPDEAGAISINDCGVVTARFTNNVEAHTLALTALTAHPELLVVRMTALSARRAEQILAELLVSYPTVTVSTGPDQVVVGLAPSQLTTAADIYRSYGDLVSITVGLLRYPDPTIDPPVCPVSAGLRQVKHLLLAISPTTLRTSEGVPIAVRVGITNRSAHNVTVRVEGSSVVVVRQGTTTVLAVSEKPEALLAPITETINAHQTVNVGSDEVGAASCRPELGWSLPPGHYDAIVSFRNVVVNGHSQGRLAQRYPLEVLPA